jgi:TPR repeat protein
MAESDLKITTGLAQQGDPKAQYKLARMYRSGVTVYGESTNKNGGFYRPSVTVVKKNPVEAAKWYLKSAQNGHVLAELELANLYLKGEGVKKDPVEAYAYYYSLAAVGLTKYAEEQVKVLEDVLSPSQIEAGQKRSQEISALIEANKKPVKK